MGDRTKFSLKLSNFVGATVNTGGGENSHLSSLRNAWGECRGVTGGVFSPPSKGSSFISGKGITGRKGSLSLRKIVLLFSLSIPYSSCELSMLFIHFTNVNPSFGFLIKRIPDEPPCYKPRVQFP